jgi:hypothetical protein
VYYIACLVVYFRASMDVDIIELADLPDTRPSGNARRAERGTQLCRSQRI